MKCVHKRIKESIKKLHFWPFFGRFWLFSTVFGPFLDVFGRFWRFWLFLTVLGFNKWNLYPIEKILAKKTFLAVFIFNIVREHVLHPPCMAHYYNTINVFLANPDTFFLLVTITLVTIVFHHGTSHYGISLWHFFTIVFHHCISHHCI